MPRTIRILPDSVVNQIAAGEVVERPASVVKELVENSLDAGARTIEIQLRSGGKRLIRVSDDGSGMSREDALLALDRHATSKIGSAEDLRGVPTFGFRGEALPSIASVSRFALETYANGEEVGTRIRARGGTITAVEEVSRTRGTTVAVENLFFNAPARGKFLKAAAAEARVVSEAISALALAQPSVGFSLTSDDRTLLDLPSSTDVVDRIGALWGEEVAEQLLAVEAREGSLGVRGVIQRPDATRPGFRRAYLFLRDRPFREPSLLQAADRGYRTTVPREHRPWLFLFLEADPATVDVNVHPSKAEVRFSDRHGIETLVEDAIRTALEGEDSAATLDHRPRAPRLQVRERDAGAHGGEESEEESQMALFLASRSPGEPASQADSNVQAREERQGSDRQSLDRPDGEVPPRLWQVHRSWILAEVRDGLLLIDQHAAHERVLFEEIMRSFQDGEEAGQRLLFPLTIRLTPAEFQVVEDLGGLLLRTGFEVEGFGGDTVIVHAVPTPHPYFDAERCFREMIEELAHGSELVRAAGNQHERVAMSFACKAAVKAGQILDPREIRELFERLFETELPYHDVHGRPTTVRLSRGELERKFGR